MQGKTMLLLAAALVIALAAIPALAQNGGFGQNNAPAQERPYNVQSNGSGQYGQQYQGNSAMNGQRGNHRGHMSRYGQAGNWNHGQGMRQGRGTGYAHRRGGGCPGWNS